MAQSQEAFTGADALAAITSQWLRCSQPGEKVPGSVYVHSTQWRLPTLLWALYVQRGSTLESMLWDFCNGIKAKHRWEWDLEFGIWFFQGSVLRYSRMQLAVAGGSSVSALRS